MTQTTNRPNRILYATQEYRSGGELKTRWYKLGVGWTHGDGKGTNIQLELPVDMNALMANGFNLVLREPLPNDAADGEIPFQ
ncbi:MAG: hypothetical protein AAF329_06820 [Cyanobacteria bacterium P01_A01_bin.17]